MTNTITTIDEYIAQFPPERQEIMRRMQQIIQEAAPQAEERIRWQMPTWWQGENLVHFANGKHHIGFYPGAEAIITFADQFAAYKTSKGAVQFQVSQPIPYELIAEVTRWRVQKASGKC